MRIKVSSHVDMLIFILHANVMYAGCSVSLKHTTLVSFVSLFIQVHNSDQKLSSQQVTNHGISSSVMRDALDAATRFFDLPSHEKMLLVSDDVHTPVRYGTSINHATDSVHYWRDFIKHYSHPLSKWINLWPSNPPCYK